MLRILTCLLILALPATLRAQAPAIDPPFPMGVQRGTTMELTLTGTNLHDPLGVVTSFPAKATFPAENNNGKVPTKLLVRLEVPPSVLLGWHSFRLVTKRGVSSARLFCVDDLPQVDKTGTPNTWDKAQPITTPCVVCGTVEKDKSDFYQFQVQGWERLSFEVLGRRLGSMLDPQLFLHDGKTRAPLDFSDDARGQGRDPRCSQVLKAGTYLLEVRDARHQGGKDWHYRLRIGDFPLTTTPLPLAVQRGTEPPFVLLAGPYTDPRPWVTVKAPADPRQFVVPLWATTPPVFPQRPSSLASWPLAVLLSDMPEAMETEPNDKPDAANLLSVPSGVSGCIHKPGDKDHYRFQGTKGVRYLIETQTTELYSPAVVQVTLKDRAGKQLGATNPEAAEAKIDFTAPADGDYTLLVEHPFYQGSPEDAYRLTIRPFAPSFALTVSVDHLNVRQGGSGTISVQVRRLEYEGPLDLQVFGPTGVHGKVTVPAKQTSAQLRFGKDGAERGSIQRVEKGNHRQAAEQLRYQSKVF